MEMLLWGSFAVALAMLVFGAGVIGGIGYIIYCFVRSR